MTHPLLARLTAELGWTAVDDDGSFEAFCMGPGEHALLIPGDPARNLETLDAAVILPELAQAFQNRFDMGVVADLAYDRPAREKVDVWPTPSLIFFRDGKQIGDIAKIRDWDDYIARTRAILDAAEAA
ncbi:hydrogenase accessory protein [Rhodovulum sp. DZ06]|uniref:hydrogenase accessory protein n=1 Tax=Rhodovulum sp. DZ06 TaxID=3425126 RepID=UPI003D345D53